MDQQELARLLLRIAGIVIAVFAFVALPQNAVMVIGMLSFASHTGLPTLGQALAMPQFWGMSFGPFAIYLAIGVLLFAGSGRIADHVSTPCRPKEVGGTADYRRIEEIAVAVLGLYLCAEGLADAARWAGTTLSVGPAFWTTQFALLGGASVRIIIGLSLMIGCRGLVALRRLIALRLSGT